ncbi:MAG: S-methyl-5-thioribose-1-phosphate isomerase [Candidatus Hadarchaeum sp.]|nr:S-methyl-5-thioribose-1-phosphate isomerase [Candidatus Hadarchaeum sp.]
MRTLELRGKSLVLIDQTLLPEKLKFIRCDSVDSIARAIKEMKVRGAPVLGVAAAMALAVAALNSRAKTKDVLLRELNHAARKIRRTRPTAVNLFVGVARVLKVALKTKGGVREVTKAVVTEAQKIAEEDIRTNKNMGKNGARFIKDGATVLTHCNAGALACVDYGTALGVIRAARDQGKRVKVIATETRPLCQGARLTAWELKRDGIPVTVITDSMVGHVMKQGLVDLVMVGSDRIAANGDVANKIGTYTVAVLAKQHRVPFYAVAPTTSIDMDTPTGGKIQIEHRNSREVEFIGGKRLVPKGVKVMNPAFDVTPARLITAIVTERGVVEPGKLKSLFKR